MKRFAFSYSTFSFTTISRLFFVGLLLLALAACGVMGTPGDGTNQDVTAPRAVSTTPVHTTTGVAINSQVIATFDEAMNTATLTSANFTVAGPGTTPVSGTVSHNASATAILFTPDGDLATNTAYTATLSIGIEDAAGNALDSAHTWAFTTGSTADVAAPSVASMRPLDAATGVATNSQIIATFDEAMNAATLTSANFTLTGPGTTPVSGTVSHNASATTVVFTPADDLATDTEYTATLSTGIEDAAGNALGSAQTWSFTTAAAAAVGTPIFLGTAGGFAILAKTGISTTGTTNIVGDIGVSPAAQTYITGFSETLHASNEFATSDIVTGRIYAADMAAPTPATMTTAIGDMETAYAEAAGRTSPDFTEVGAGDISGMTLVPGLYKWGTGLSINTDVTLDGGPNDVWIFQIAQDLTMAPGVQVLLAGGAMPENIFWQVAGQVTLDTTSVFNGIALSKTQVVVSTGAVVNGRLLAQTAVTLDANAVTAP